MGLEAAPPPPLPPAFTMGFVLDLLAPSGPWPESLVTRSHVNSVALATRPAMKLAFIIASALIASSMGPGILSRNILWDILNTSTSVQGRKSKFNAKFETGSSIL
jgi:hypothetical protein